MKRLIVLGCVVFGLAIAGCGSSTPQAPVQARKTHSAGPSAAPTQASSPSDVAPSAGASLASVSGEGRVNVIANLQGQGFDVVDSLLDGNNDESTVQAYGPGGTSLAKLPPGSLTGECGAADVVNSQGRLLITEQITTVPAAGINPATNSLVLTAWNATSGNKVWTATPISSTTDDLSCTAFDGNLQNFSVTFDGKWGVLEWSLTNSNVSDAVDLTNGKLYPRANLQGTLGNYVVMGTDHTYFTGEPNIATMTVPGAWPKLGRFKLGTDDPGDVPLDPGEFVPTGQLANENYSNPPVMEATPDGTELIGIVGNASYGIASMVTAYALPSGQLLWSLKTPRYDTDTLEGVNGSVAIIGRVQNNNGDDSTTLMALDVKTGQVAWKTNIGGGTLCDLTSSQILVSANAQLATLSAATGQQLSYKNNPYQDPTGSQDCPVTVGDGITGVGYTGNQVTQLLDP
jgi:PQQ-like domain